MKNIDSVDYFITAELNDNSRVHLEGSIERTDDFDLTPTSLVKVAIDEIESIISRPIKTCVEFQIVLRSDVEHFIF